MGGLLNNGTDRAMVIDSPSVMYGTFQRCRHFKPDCSELLELLNNILEAVSQQRRFLAEVPEQLVPDKWKKALHDDTERAIRYIHERGLKDHDALLSKSVPVFSLLQIGTRELQRLWAIQATFAVRSLGYAFHVLPELLRTPEDFRLKSYRLCFRIISAHWDELSLEMREAICNIVGLKLQSADTLVKSLGFSLEMWGQNGREENRGIMIVDDDPWIEEGGQT